jgi:hypothetical protein
LSLGPVCVKEEITAVGREGEPAEELRGPLSLVFERSSGLDLSPVDLPAPTLFLDRASTHAGVRKQGLNSVLRCYFLRAAMGWEYPSVNEWLFSGESRTNTQPFAGCGISFPEGPRGSGNPSKAAASARRRRRRSSRSLN